MERRLSGGCLKSGVIVVGDYRLRLGNPANLTGARTMCFYPPCRNLSSPKNYPSGRGRRLVYPCSYIGSKGFLVVGDRVPYHHTSWLDRYCSTAYSPAVSSAYVVASDKIASSTASSLSAHG